MENFKICWGGKVHHSGFPEGHQSSQILFLPYHTEMRIIEMEVQYFLFPWLWQVGTERQTECLRFLSESSLRQLRVFDQNVNVQILNLKSGNKFNITRALCLGIWFCKYGESWWWLINFLFVQFPSTTTVLWFAHHCTLFSTTSLSLASKSRTRTREDFLMQN